MKTHINVCALGVRSPHSLVQISWVVDGSSGSTICEAWRGQFEIEQLERAGYEITCVERAGEC